MAYYHENHMKFDDVHGITNDVLYQLRYSGGAMPVKLSPTAAQGHMCGKCCCLHSAQDKAAGLRAESRRC
jgi:hypothetical protein